MANSDADTQRRFVSRAVYSGRFPTTNMTKNATSEVLYTFGWPALVTEMANMSSSPRKSSQYVAH